MIPRKNLFRWMTQEWMIGLYILGIFLLTNGYTFGWDDQHLEIPLLKGLIDPALYPGDYYVESLKQHFISYLYPVLSRLIGIRQIPATYLALFLLSRYVLFLFIFKLWRLVSRDKTAAFLSTLMIFLIGRVEEFLYRTFSHQEFALAIIFAGIYLFYKERFVWAAAILGIAANFHALYSLFPFIYLSVYLAIFHKPNRWRLLLQSSLAFAVFASPVIGWAVRQKTQAAAADPTFYQGWTSLYKIACPQNFIFYDNSLREVLRNGALFFQRTQAIWLLIAFLVLNLFFNERFRRDRKALAVIVSGFALILFSFFFTYVVPSRFVLDLNLVRNLQYILFILMGYTTLLFVDVLKNEKIFTAVGMTAAFGLIRFGDDIAITAGGFLFFLLALNALTKPREGRPRHRWLLLPVIPGLVASVIAVVLEFKGHHFSQAAVTGLLTISGLAVLTGILTFVIKSSRGRQGMRFFLVVLPFSVFFINLMAYHLHHLRMEKEAGGFWQLQRNWVDMQRYVHDNVPREALLLVPYDMEMGGFRIFSERKIIASYRDCGIVGFDYAAAVEWQRRIKDIEAFKVMIDGPVVAALTNAIFKYRANYIVFMRYIHPGANSLMEPVYTNETFALYKVTVNPVPAPGGT